MTTIRATLENGNLLLQEPLPKTEGQFSALVIIADDHAANQSPLEFPRQKIVPADIPAEKEFEEIGLRDFFGDPIDECINWEAFFSPEK